MVMVMMIMMTMLATDRLFDPYHFLRGSFSVIYWHFRDPVFPFARTHASPRSPLLFIFYDTTLSLEFSLFLSTIGIVFWHCYDNDNRMLRTMMIMTMMMMTTSASRVKVIIIMMMISIRNELDYNFFSLLCAIVPELNSKKNLLRNITRAFGRTRTRRFLKTFFFFQ